MRLELRLTVALLATAVATSGLFGCDKVADMVGKKAKQEAEKAIAEAADPSKAPGGATAGPDLFVDASSVPLKLKEKIKGPTRVLELLIYPQFSKAQIQDPAKKLNVDEYEYRNGAVDDGGPVKFIGNQPTEKDLAEVTFAIEDVDFSQVPRMVKDAPVQLGVDGGKVTHMMLKRPLPFEKEVRWRVYVSSERRDGSVEYDAKGVKKKVWQ
jgi:hypothetical protein